MNNIIELNNIIDNESKSVNGSHLGHSCVFPGVLPFIYNLYEAWCSTQSADMSILTTSANSSPAYTLGQGRGRARKRQHWRGGSVPSRSRRCPPSPCKSSASGEGFGGGRPCVLSELATRAWKRRRARAFGRYSLLVLLFEVSRCLYRRNCNGHCPPRYSQRGFWSPPLCTQIPCVVKHLPCVVKPLLLCSALECHALSDKRRL